MPSQDGPAGDGRTRGWALRVVVAGVVVALGLARPGAAAVVECASADVACLIVAINTANANGEVNTIRLQPGTYTLRAVHNETDESNGLPSITSPLTVVGAGAGSTIIERDATGPNFRLFHVGQAGLLKLKGLTARGGRLAGTLAQFGGGGLLNRGTAIISQSVLTENFNDAIGPGGPGGGGIASLGRLVIAGSVISNNSSGGFGGGVFSLAELTVINSTISRNTGNLGGGLFIEGMAIIIGSTIADNLAFDGNGGGVFSFSTAVAIINSTLAGNRTSTAGAGGGFAGGGGIIVNSTIANNDAPGGSDALSAGSALALYNTIIGPPSFLGASACLGRVTSLGNNLFIDPNCAVALLSDDVTGDPRLGDFTDDGTPGHGFLPLLRRSPAINAGDGAACLPIDQRGRRRTAKGCDIGAIEGIRP